MNRRWSVFVVSIVVALTSSGRNWTRPTRETASEHITRDAIRQLKAMPIAFEENIGQTSAAASFVARGQGYAVWATANGPVLRLRDARASKPGAVVRMRVVGGGPKGHPSADSPLAGRANYFIGNDPSRWRTGVTRFGALRYDDVYPGVDLVLHGTQQSLEYDFDVAPLADPSQIAVSFDGAQAVRIDSNGNLTLTVGDGEIGFRPPVAYQERRGMREVVAARYDVDADGVVRFALGEYDPARPLTIDPVLSYSTYVGGTVGQSNLSGNDKAFALAVDVFGNAYLAGFTSAIDFPLAGPPFDTSCGGCTNSGGDAWVAKINPAQSGAASLVFATYLGSGGTGSGTGSSTAYAVAVDSSGNVYLTGNTSAFDNPSTPTNEGFPTTPTAFQPNAGGGLDAFLTKLNPTGSTLLYSTYIGGNNTDEGSAVRVDDSGHAYVAGWAASANFPEVLNGFRMSNPDLQFDGFVAKFDTTLSGAASLQYGTLVGGGSSDRIGALALDALGRVYVTGYTQSSGAVPFPVLNGFQTASLGGQDSFMTMINPSLSGASSLVYSTLISSNGTENGAQQEGGIAVDAFGKVYVTGSTLGGNNFPTTPGAFKSVLQSSDGYVVKIDPSQNGQASLVASTLIGGTFQEGPTGLVLDQSNNPIVVGWTGSSDIGATACALPKPGGTDGFVMVLDPSLASLKFSTPIGGSGADFIYGLGIGPLGQIYLAGYTESTNFPSSVFSATTTAAFDATLNGQDAFLTVIASPLDTCAAPIAGSINATTAEDTPKSLTLTATDLDGNKVTPDALTWKVTVVPSHGTLDVSAGAMTHDSGSAYSAPVVYTPAANYSGPDSFQFRVNDGWFTSANTIVNINVTPVNDPPTANPQSVTTAEETAKLITLTGSDPETAPQFLTFTFTLNPTHGTLSGSGASRTYTPATNYFGQDSFTFTVTDPSSAVSSPATVSITVTNVNDAPVTTADGITTQEDVPVTVPVLANDTDVDGDSLSVTLVSCGNGAGAVINPDKSITVTPAANFNGPITCTYTVDDGHGGTTTGQLTVTVNAVNDLPVTAPDAATTPEDVPATVNVLGNDTDADGDSLSVTQVSCGNGAAGAIVVNNEVKVTPILNFNGSIACTYTADDGHGGSTGGQLTVTVTPVNDNPTAMPDAAATDDNSLIVVNVLANDNDPDGNNTLSLGPVIVCQSGTATPNPDDTINYQPLAGFGGTDQCSYTVTDGVGGTASGVLTVTVTKVNDPPTLDNPGDQVTEEGIAVSLQLNATDPDGDALTFLATGLPAGLAIDANGLISGAPAAGSAGSYPVDATVSDGQGGSITVHFTWIVTSYVGSNQAPACQAAYPSVSVVWPPDHRLVPIGILGVTDPDGGQPAISVTRILQDEPTNTTGDGSTWIDGFGIGTSTPQIRAERTGTPKVPGDGRVYEIFFTASDVHGATCTGSVLVSIPHDQGSDPAIDSLVRYDSTVPGGQPLGKP